MLTSTPSWAAVMTHSGAETAVASRFSEAEPPIESYLPLLAIRDRRHKKDDMPEKPMFPCYLFVHINNKQIFQTRTTKGVIAIVSSNHNIIRVPDKEIEAIRRFEESQRKIHLYETAQLVKGAPVTILSGEFAGMEGRLVKDCKDGNFSVQISALNISFVVQVKRSELRPPVGTAATDEESSNSQNHQ